MFLNAPQVLINSSVTALAGKHASSGDETPPIPEEELEQQKIEHERQMQKEKEQQAKEDEEVRQLDLELLHQRAIEAEEEQKQREVAEAVEELRGMNTSWSHHRLCDLQRQAARWRHSRPSIPDTTRHHRGCHPAMLKKASSAQLTHPESSHSIGDSEGLFMNLSRLRSYRDESIDSDVYEAPDGTSAPERRAWRASASDVSPHASEMVRAPSCPGQVLLLVSSRGEASVARFPERREPPRERDGARAVLPGASTAADFEPRISEHGALPRAT